MATETIKYNGQEILTLKELLRPGLKAVFVGMNPAPTSVSVGHYYQGRAGCNLRRRFRKYGVTPPLAANDEVTEDDALFDQGFGFADLVRRPTASANELSREEKSAGIPDLIERLRTAMDTATNHRPHIIFTFGAGKIAGPQLRTIGYQVFEMPAPYDSISKVDAIMKDIQIGLEIYER